MTREEIEELEAGEELDKLVAIHVMGWSIYHYDKDVPERCYYMLVDSGLDAVADDMPWSWRNGERKTEEEAWKDNKPWSTDITAAWKVFEKFGYQGRVGYQGMDYFASVMVGFEDNGDPRYGDANERSSAAEAICIAALIGVFVGEPIG